MHVVAIASRKGGSGKTTLSGHLAVQAEICGDGPVAVGDLDPQGSLAEWWNARGAETPAFLQVRHSTLAKDIERLGAGGIKSLFLDLPPELTASVAEAIRQADLVVIPVRPSPHDLRSVGKTVDFIEEIDRPLVFVLNGATARSRIATEAVSALSQHGPVCPIVVHNRVDFASSMIDGRTVMELSGSGRSSQEMAGLWDYVSDRLDGGICSMTSAIKPSALGAPRAPEAGEQLRIDLQ